MLAYHAKTMHSYESIRSSPHRMDWSNQPSVFKHYPHTFTRIPLNKDIPTHHFLYLIGGVTAQKSYPGVTYSLRTNPSAGALYPTEVYVQIRQVKGFDDGLYHLSPSDSSLVLLSPLRDDEGIEPLLHVNKTKGFVFLFSAIYFRSSWKYRDRAFRYCLQDTGHMLGALEASCYLMDYGYTFLYDFDKMQANRHFGFNQEEFFLSCALVGEISQTPAHLLSLSLPTISGRFQDNPLINYTYKATLNPHTPQKQIQTPRFSFKKEKLKETIIKRRSAREFFEHSITKEEFETVVSYLNQPIPSNNDTTIELYWVINRVQGMWKGVWKEGEYIKTGDFSTKAGYLCLEQALGRQSAVTLFMLSLDRNYQASVQKAGLLGHRLYLIANYLGIECSGIGAYYDEEVALFLEAKGMVIYTLVIGR